MADRTLGFKVSDEIHEKARMLIEASGLSAKEWLEQALTMYEVKAIHANTPHYAKDLTELELHTTRIYELVLNMIQQSVYLQDHAVKEIQDKLLDKEIMISDFQMSFLQFKEEIATKNKAIQALQETEKELKAKLHANETTHATNQALIAEYKEKNDTLSGLITKYQGYAEENETLKTAIEAQQTAATEQTNQLAQAHARIRELEQTLENAQQHYTRELDILRERKDLEREKALVEAERNYQAKLQAERDQYNEKIADMHTKLNTLD